MSHRRAAPVVVALLLAYLTASAMPVAALQTNTAVGSNNTTDTDFNGADTLTGVVVTDSGSAADVFYGNLTIDDVEDGDIAEWTGDTGVFEANSSVSHRGSNSIRYLGGSSGSIDRSIPADDYTNVSYWVNDSSFANENDPIVRFRSGTTDVIRIAIEGGGAELAGDDGSVVIFNSSGTWVDTGINIQTDAWFKIEPFDIDYGANTFSIAVYDDSGTAQGTATGLEFDNAASQIDTVRLQGTGSADEYFIDDIHAVTTEGTGTYIGGNHSVDNVVNGFTNLTLQDTQTTVTWQEFTSGSWSDIRTDTYTTTGNKSVDISSATATKLRVNVTFQSNGANPVAELHDEGVTFTNHEPAVDNSSGTPTGDLATSSPTLKIGVNDTEFGTAQGDSVTVEFFVDGNSVGTDTLTSNGTASVTASNLNGGDHTWHAVATDSYGLSNTSQDFAISIPSNLTIRNETSPHGPITGSNTSVTFYELADDNPTIIERNDSDGDGNISLSGLPVGSSFAVTVETPGYYNRTVLIDDIFTQSNVFLLNKDHSASRITFTIEDTTGAFTGSDAEILVQRAINQSKYNTGGVAWLTISGDRTGAANELVVQLQQNTRHRLKVSNDDETRIVGSYTPVGDDAVTLRPTAPSINVSAEGTYIWNATQINTSSGGRIEFEFYDPNSSTTDLTLFIYERGNKSNSFVNQTVSGPLGYAKVTQTLTEAESDKAWVVYFNATRDGSEISDSTVVSKGIVPQLAGLVPWVRHALAITAIVLILASFSVVNAETGAIVASFVGGGFWFVGWLPSGAGAAVGVALFTVFGWKIARRRVA